MGEEVHNYLGTAVTFKESGERKEGAFKQIHNTFSFEIKVIK